MQKMPFSSPLPHEVKIAVWTPLEVSEASAAETGAPSAGRAIIIAIINEMIFFIVPPTLNIRVIF